MIFFLFKLQGVSVLILRAFDFVSVIKGKSIFFQIRRIDFHRYFCMQFCEHAQVGSVFAYLKLYFPFCFFAVGVLVIISAVRHGSGFRHIIAAQQNFGSGQDRGK